MTKDEKKTERKLDCRVDTIEHFFKDMLGLVFFGKNFIDATYTAGESKLVLVTGQNATGKSFVRRIVGACLSEHKIESIALSMEKRAGGVDRIFNTFIWGDEGDNATGSLSSNAIIGAIKTSHSRNKENKPHVIFWDEPDVGLSDDYAAGAADEIVEFVNAAPEKLKFVVLVTHRRAMLERLALAKPHHVRLGDTKTLEEVLTAPVVPRRLEELRERNLAMFRRISKEFKL